MKVDVPILAKMSPPMRTSALVTGCAVLACLALILLAIRPALNDLTYLRTDIKGLEVQLKSMKADIAGTAKQRAKTAAATAARDALLTRGELEPLLGSFAMRGKALLDPVAQETGFTISGVRELPLIPLRTPPVAPLQLYGRQPIEFTGQGSFAQISAFIAQTEKHHPMTVLSSIRILGQPQVPERHKAIITFEWPAKGEKRPMPAPKAAK